MKTNCECCCAEIDDDEIEMCDVCGWDGLCTVCYLDHDCEEDEPSQRSTDALNVKSERLRCITGEEMKLPKIQIEKARGEIQQSRYNLDAVYFDAQNKTMTATDGHVIVVAPCDPGKELESGGITMNDKEWIAARSNPYRDIALPEKVLYPEKVDSSLGWDKHKGRPDIILGVDVLKKLLQAFTTYEREDCPRHIGIWINNDEDRPSQSAAMFAEMGVKEGAIALVMPIRPEGINDTAEDLVASVFKKEKVLP